MILNPKSEYRNPNGQKIKQVLKKFEISSLNYCFGFRPPLNLRRPSVRRFSGGRISCFGVFLCCFINVSGALAADTAYSGNFVVPEAQSGFAQEGYEVKAIEKLQRGAENFLLSPLEVPQGVKAEIAGRRSEYLPVGMETVIVGAVRGFIKGWERLGVGVYEILTFTYPQEPILPEFQEWLY